MTDVEGIEYAPYILEYGDYGCYTYRPLRPTGRWKIRSDAYEVEVMYVEHRGLLFRSWIHERNIEFMPSLAETVFDCNSTEPKTAP